MNMAEKASLEIRSIDELAAQKSPMHELSPLVKLMLTMLYIFITVSFNKYDFYGLFVMILFPIIGYQFGFISVITCFKKLRVVMPLVCAVGIVNPFFDRDILFIIAGVEVSGGFVSMLTLMMKGIFSLMMSFLLVVTTPVGEICRALRQLHVPKLLTSLFLLTFRYVTVMLDEVAIMITAYHLRAPKQKGIEFKAWGSFVGQIILRSMDRADALYESMRLRGFDGEFYYSERRINTRISIVIGLIFAVLIVLVRFFNVPAIIIGLFA